MLEFYKIVTMICHPEVKFVVAILAVMLNTCLATHLIDLGYNYRRIPKSNIAITKPCSVYTIGIFGRPDFYDVRCGARCNKIMQCFHSTVEDGLCKLCIDTRFTPSADEKFSNGSAIQGTSYVFEKVEYEDTCTSKPCLNGACTDLGYDFSCQCYNGYIGKTCNTDLCTPNPCLNGATCVRTPGAYTCSCVPGFVGTTCQTNLCNPNPCKNYGTCVGTAGSYSCTCVAGFTGTTCQTNSGPVVTSTLAAGGGLGEGSWQHVQYCPTGSYVTAFKLKIDSCCDVFDDDTGANGIEMRCTNPNSGSTTGYIKSGEMSWGSWYSWRYCTTNYFAVAFKMHTEPGTLDKQGVNNVEIRCRGSGPRGTGTTHHEGHGTHGGGWNGYSSQCSSDSMVCGIQTKIQGSQGAFGDDMALTDFQLKCCRY